MTTTLLTILQKYNFISMVNAFVKSILSFVMMEGMVMGVSAKDVQSHAGAFGAVILAFLLRVAMDSKKEKPTLFGIIYQVVVTSALCYLAVFVWNDYLDYAKGFEIYLFGVSLFAVVIAAQLDGMFEFGLKTWFRNFIGRVMATKDVEDLK